MDTSNANVWQEMVLSMDVHTNNILEKLESGLTSTNEVNSSLKELVNKGESFKEILVDAVASLAEYDLFQRYPGIVPLRSLIDMLRVNRFLVDYGAHTLEGCISSHLVNVQADAKLLTMSAMDYCFDPLFYAKLSHTRVTIRNGVQTISLVNTANALYSCIKNAVEKVALRKGVDWIQPFGSICSQVMANHPNSAKYRKALIDAQDVV